MKRFSFVLIPVLMIVMLLSACSGDVSTPHVASVEKDLSELEKGGSIVLSQIGAGTEIALSDFSLDDGIYIETVKKGISKDGNDSVSENLFMRQDGSFIPIPDQQGSVSFTGRDLNLRETGEIIVHRLLNLDDDFEIRAKEPQHLWHSTEFIAEEFYYVSFLDQRFSSLDRSEIVFVTSGSGHQGVSILQEGMLNKNADGVFDFSGKWFTGFAVNMYKAMIADSDDSIKLFILNPTHVDSTPKTLDKQVNVIMVDEQSAGSYRVVVSFSGDDASSVIRNIATSYQALQYLPRYKNGQFRADYFYPEFDLENKQITYHLGSVDKAFLFNLYFDESTGFQPGTATVVVEEDDSGFEPFDVTELDNEIVIKAPSNGIVTWSYKAATEVEIWAESVTPADSYSVKVSDRGRGTGDVGEQMELYGFGFFVLNYTGNETDVPLFRISRYTKKGLDCSAVAWDYDSEDYVCIDDNCAHCADLGHKQHYSRFFIEYNKDEIFHDTVYWTAGNFESYGRIGWGIPFSVSCSNNSNIRTETFGGDSRFPAPPRVIAANTNNRKEMVKIYLQKIILSENKIVVDIALNDPETWYHNVEMVGVHEHTWTISGNKVKCSVCNAERMYSKMHVQAGSYTMKTNKAFAMWVPSLDFKMNIPGSCDLPYLPTEADVYFIALEAGQTITVSKSGNTFTAIIST